MKVKHLLEEILECRKIYGDDFIEWDIYTEQLGVGENTDFKKEFGNTYKNITDPEGCTSVKTGGSTRFPKEKIFTLNLSP